MRSARSLGVCVVCHDTEVILIVAQPAAYHTVWLQSVHQLIQFLALFRSVGTHVKPKFGDGTVVGQQFGNLGFGEFMMLWGDEITVMAGDRIGLWKMPVYQ